MGNCAIRTVKFPDLAEPAARKIAGEKDFYRCKKRAGKEPATLITFNNQADTCIQPLLMVS